MPTIDLLPSLLGARMLSSNIFDGVLDLEIATRTSTRLTLLDEGDRLSFIGTGFAHQMLNGAIVGVTGGTVRQMTITDADSSVTYLNWYGLDLSAPTFFDHLSRQNWSALNNFLRGTSDTYNLTNAGDQVRGIGGNDVMNGLGGNDRLFGVQGNNRLNGGNGADSLTGSAGIDTLAGGAAHRFIYTKSTGNLWYDADGSGAGARGLVAELADGTVLTAADIFIV